MGTRTAAVSVPFQDVTFLTHSPLEVGLSKPALPPDPFTRCLGTHSSHTEHTSVHADFALDLISFLHREELEVLNYRETEVDLTPG